MSTDTKRPLPQFHHADDDEILVYCSECEWGPEAQSSVQKAFDAFDLHASRDHAGWVITQPWQAAEVLSDRVDGFSDAEGCHVWQWIVDHVSDRGDLTPQMYLLLVADAAESLSHYAIGFAEAARDLHDEMPVDNSQVRV